MKWEDLSQRARDVMKDIGDFGPTVKPENREVKGWTPGDDGTEKTYYSSADLRDIAEACVEVADWLDKRGELAERPADA